MICYIFIFNISFLRILFLSSPEETKETRKLYKKVKEKIKIGTIFLTRFEKARIVGARALQISYGAPILIIKPKEVIDPIKIAQLELEADILPLTLRRKLPVGEFQDIPIKWLIVKKS